MTISEFANKYSINFNAKKAIVLLLSENPVQTNEVSKVAKIIDIPFKFEEGSILKKMLIVNNMVKSCSCPNNARNNFYKKKKALLKMLYRENPDMMKITDQGNYFGFEIDGLKFHQLKFCWPELNGDFKKEEYFKSSETMEFDKNSFIDFCLSYFLTYSNQ